MKANPQPLQRDLDALLLPPAASLRQALAAIDRGAIELAFVAGRGRRILGTLSDGDVRRAILACVDLDEPGAAGRVMRRDFIQVHPGEDRNHVLDLMRARHITQVPILDGRGRMVGLHLMRELIGGAKRANPAVIMAGGQGLRLRPLTERLPKPMIRVAGRPILERIVVHLVGHGIREIYLAINYLGDMIERHFQDGSALGCRIRYLRETEPLGTGGALSLLPRSIREAVLVLNGDLVTQARVDRILDFHARGDYFATVCLRPHQLEVPFGVAEVKGDRLAGLREKPAQDMLINAGIYVLSPRALRMVPRGRDYPITDLLGRGLSRGLKVGAHIIDEDWADVGRPQELHRARGG